MLWNNGLCHPIGFIPRLGSSPRNAVPLQSPSQPAGTLVCPRQLCMVVPRLLGKCQAARCLRQVGPAACPGSWQSSSPCLVVPVPAAPTCSGCREEPRSQHMAMAGAAVRKNAKTHLQDCTGGLASTCLVQYGATGHMWLLGTRNTARAMEALNFLTLLHSV